MSHEPEADELRVRSILRKHGVGPDAEPPPAPPGPPPAGFEPDPDRDDWWADEMFDGVYDDETDEPEEEPERTPAFEPQPGYWPHPRMPDAVTSIPERAATAISPRSRELLYNASAAGAGWAFGLYHQFAAAIEDCGRSSIGGALVLGTGGCLLIAHVWDRRTRHWQPGLLAWCARIPLATAICALALWAPAAP